MSVTSFLDQNSALVCERYREEARQANSKPALASMLDVNVCEWLCKMQPNHDSAAWLTTYFANFINGKWAKDCGGYTCAVYAGYEGEIELKDTVTAIIGCNEVRLIIPDNAFVRVFCSESKLIVKSRGKNAKIVIEATAGAKAYGVTNETDTLGKEFITVKELKTL